MTVESRVKTRVQGVRGLGCFKCDTLSKKKNCYASTIPSRAYINHIQKNFFPRTSLEGQTTWSKMVKIDQISSSETSATQVSGDRTSGENLLAPMDSSASPTNRDCLSGDTW